MFYGLQIERFGTQHEWLRIESEWHGLYFENNLCSKYNMMGSWSNLPPSLDVHVTEQVIESEPSPTLPSLPIHPILSHVITYLWEKRYIKNLVYCLDPTRPICLRLRRELEI